VGIDEMIFYGGIAVMAAAFVLGMISMLLLKVKKIKLDAKLDAEYGKEIGNSTIITGPETADNNYYK
jgi:hypothetical protein